MSKEVGLTNWYVQAFFLFQNWHHLCSGWPETTHNSTTWFNYFRMGEFSNQIGVKIANDIQMLKYSFPSLLQQLPVTPVYVLNTSVMVGCLCGTHTWTAWFSCRRQRGPSHSPGSPMSPELPSWSYKMLCINKQTCVWMKKKTEISLTLLVHGAPNPP